MPSTMPQEHGLLIPACIIHIPSPGMPKGESHRQGDQEKGTPVPREGKEVVNVKTEAKEEGNNTKDLNLFI